METFEYDVGAKETLQVNGNPIETVRLKPRDAKARQSIEVRQAVNNQNLPVNVRFVDRKGTVNEQVAANIRFE